MGLQQGGYIATLPTPLESSSNCSNDVTCSSECMRPEYAGNKHCHPPANCVHTCFRTTHTHRAMEPANPVHTEHSGQARFSLFSPNALALLPKLSRPRRYTRADDIPETQPDNDGQQPTVRDYHAINLPPQVRVPKKLPTPIRVEGKVWFANERSK